MRFPWTRNREARQARQRAEAQLEAVRAQWPDVRAQVAQTEHHKRENNIAARVSAMLEGKR